MERPISFERCTFNGKTNAEALERRCTFQRKDLVIPAEAEVGENYKEME